MKILKWFVLLSVVWISGCTSTEQVSTDENDQCPKAPAGVEVDEVGCPLDSDGDGVADYMDQCPATPQGAAVDEVGCPLDSDGDGVADYMDECPATAKGVEVDEVGCPMKPKVASYVAECGDTIEMNGDRIIGFKHVLFDFDSDVLKPEGQQVLSCVAMAAKEIKIPLALDGYTCFVGDDAYNERLSQRRANAARDYLVDQGVSESMMKLEWFGEADPVADNNNLDQRYLNRRVEVKPQ